MRNWNRPSIEQTKKIPDCILNNSSGLLSLHASFPFQEHAVTHHNGYIYAPFDQSTYATRIKQIQFKMKQAYIDTFVCTCRNNVYYLTNYQTPGNPLTAVVIPQSGPPKMVTRQLEFTNVHFRTCIAYETYNEYEDPAQRMARIVHCHFPRRIGYKGISSRITMKQQRVLEAYKSAEWIGKSLVER